MLMESYSDFKYWQNSQEFLILHHLFSVVQCSLLCFGQRNCIQSLEAAATVLFKICKLTHLAPKHGKGKY